MQDDIIVYKKDYNKQTVCTFRIYPNGDCTLAVTVTEFKLSYHRNYSEGSVELIVQNGEMFETTQNKTVSLNPEFVNFIVDSVEELCEKM